ncbi:methyltransferase domain-containing protein [Streptomyces albireticuli]|uniref:methyltransferase domain-containing protein n=1 Tax=Streptomyces albireticuli TaxID=1940 RepID=UPI001E3B1B70|nr:methyltransferase domain-containing protein [Streptomyces albireticuli]MCD9166206.1 methyltransferase domain-containing protein [Streptomyces albireticuli]MCD9196522.1 methyltransferase domain-containing protein [Streptomyces albireticuli]
MTATSGWRELVARLAPDGTLTAGWRPVFEALPRAGFLPDVIWQHHVPTGNVTAVDRTRDPRRWQAAADSGDPLVTQWDDGEHHGLAQGRVASSSASAPSVVAAMLTDLDVHPGQRVLEVGTGTGWNAGLLARRLGAGAVTTIEVDQALADAARTALERQGLGAVTVVCGDGFQGHAAKAPYDRVIATCGVRTVPAAWLEQCRPGGRIVVPWGTRFTRTEATVALTVAGDGRSASGPFTSLVQFMSLRAQRQDLPAYADYVTDESREKAEQGTTVLTLGAALAGEWDISRFVLGLLVPDCVVVFDARQEGRQPVWLCGLGEDRSWACVLFREDGKPSTVYQYGSRRLWDETETAHAWWHEQDRPGLGRLGLTVDDHGQHIWVDTPDHAALSNPA